MSRRDNIYKIWKMAGGELPAAESIIEAKSNLDKGRRPKLKRLKVMYGENDFSDNVLLGVDDRGLVYNVFPIKNKKSDRDPDYIYSNTPLLNYKFKPVYKDGYIFISLDFSEIVDLALTFGTKGMSDDQKVNFKTLIEGMRFVFVKVFLNKSGTLDFAKGMEVYKKDGTPVDENLLKLIPNDRVVCIVNEYGIEKHLVRSFHEVKTLEDAKKKNSFLKIKADYIKLMKCFGDMLEQKDS